MANPLDKIKKLKGRSLKEIQTRGGQAVAAYSEKMGLRGKLLNDKELVNVINSKAFATSKDYGPKVLLDKFYSDSESSFFPSFCDIDETVRVLSSEFGKETCDHFIAQADKMIDGRYDLLGFRNLDFGQPVDWHLEPVSEKHSPVVHWKQFDEADSKETGDKKIVWELNRHQHFFILGIAYRLTGDEKYAECFAAQIKDWMEENPPSMGVNWVSSLEVSFRSISWIWAFHMFRGASSLTPDVFGEALKYLISHGRHIEKYLSTYYSPNTHLTGEALGLYYLGTQLRFLSEAESWRATGEQILLEELDRQIRPDGIYFEQSTWYQKYTTDFYLHFLVLNKLNGGSLAPKQHQKLLRALLSLLDSQMYFTRPDGSSPLIGDDDGGRMLPLTTAPADDFRGTLAAGAVIFKRGDYKWVSGESTQDLLWLFGPQGIRKFNSIKAYMPENRSRAFAESGFYLMRDGWSEDDNYMLVDAGQVGSLNGGHGHADTHSFDLAVGGRTLLVDPGTYTYHKSRELRNAYRSSVAHNTLTIDDKPSSEFGGIFSWNSMAEPTVHSWISQDRFDFLETSHDGYSHLEDSPANCSRSILFLKNDYWIMRDFVKTAGQHEYQQNFHFTPDANPSIENIVNGTSCIDESPGSKIGLRMFTFGDNGGWQRKESWISRCYGERTIAPFIRYVSTGVGPQEFITFMIPNEAGFDQPEVFESELAGGRAFVINYRNYQDLFLFADGEQIIRTELFNTDFRFSWARMSASEKLPEEFVLIGGRNFTLGGREILNSPNQLDFVTARRFGNRLNVRKPEGVFSISLPQKSSRTYILKTTPEI